jgi:AraC-like DNA-binding protein
MKIPQYNDDELNTQSAVTPLLSRTLPEFAVSGRSILLFDFHWVLNDQTAKTFHSHRFLEVHVPYSGICKLHTKEHTAIFKPGECAIVPAGTLHTWGTMKSPTKMHVWWMLPSDDSPKNDNEKTLIDELFCADGLVYPIPENYFTLIDMLFTELSTPCDGVDEVLRSIMRQLVISWARLTLPSERDKMRLVKTRKPPEKLTDRMLMSRVDEFIQSNLMHQITIDEIAAHIRVSPSTLMHRYSARKGQSIWRTVTEMRMERAKSLLLNSDLSIGEIAQRCGIQDKHYFSNKFKSWFGSTPRQIRGKSELNFLTK